ncbi:MAG: hypothetical protein BZ138_08540 [Methanosphaera sp. rholeuAM270]|nr:MAG: hypothetical protein BZ138_08540 [Methanosphaera sp. rholeuAM270]
MSKGLDDMMMKVFPDAMNNRRQGKCPFCGKLINPDEEFRDQLSVKEYHISGLCQKCQDEVFKEPTEEY